MKKVAIVLVVIMVIGILAGGAYALSDGFKKVPWEKDPELENKAEIALNNYIGDWSIAFGKGENTLSFSAETEKIYVDNLADRSSYFNISDIVCSDNNGAIVSGIDTVVNGTLYDFEAKFQYNYELVNGLNNTRDISLKMQTYELSGVLRQNYIRSLSENDCFPLNPYSLFNTEDLLKVELNRSSIDSLDSKFLGYWDITLSCVSSDYYDISADISMAEAIESIRQPNLVSLNYMIPVYVK